MTPETDMATVFRTQNEHGSRYTVQADPLRKAADDTSESPVAALRAEGAGVSYRTRRGQTEALCEVNLQVGDGEFVAVLGPSGCGKSTLLKLAAGLVAPSQGRVLLDGHPIKAPGRDTGVAFQKPNLLPWKTVLGNVLLPARTLKLPMAEACQRAARLLDLVGLSAFARHYPNELSGGMQQRVGIARMLLGDPRLLLMDEPFAALDALTREALTFELQRIWLSQSKSVLFITHSIPEAVFLADRVIVMSARPGRVIEDFHVMLPRPRLPETMSSVQFVGACTHLRSYLQ
ncbi:ABC transporter ATP-binding protein [Paraburkholderia tropica]|uniref:ABC transporter ATP-binding protein n=1 Tax=Paraburkholderia tropica TaxID=92647 RepID=UPI002AB7551A|nr:ABC transporter ATP-binding protein [Paraburkholderia tropica]